MRFAQLATSAVLASLFFGASAYAGSTTNPVPEPGTWALVGLAAAIGWAVTRSKRK